MNSKNTKYSKYLIQYLVFSFLIIYNLNAQEPQLLNEKRGVVVYPSDLKSLGAMEWVSLLSKNSLNLIGIHTDTRLEPITDLESFLNSKEGKAFLEACKENGIGVEYELHALQDLLPRSLFNSHPEYFRMDEDGKRQQEYNMCFTSEEAYLEIEKRIVEITRWLKPSTHRYFFWTDDVQFAFCQCEDCKSYSVSEQALLYENKLLTILRKIDPLAQVAHLAYTNTMESPKKVKPLEGVFLEYAPIQRNYKLGLTEKNVNDLRDNLKVFPKETAHILEYWLDVSMFSNWDRAKLKKLPWNREYLERDVNEYRSLGVTSITSFAAWMNKDYMDKYGIEHFEEVFEDYGKTLNSSESIMVDSNLDDWDKNMSTKGLTDPWDLKSKEKVNWYTNTIPNSKTPDFHIPSAFELIIIQ